MSAKKTKTRGKTRRKAPSKATPKTTTVDLVIRLQVEGSPAEVAKHLGALQCLASVMATQAEDGLWSAGHPDGETDDGPSTHVADIPRAYEQTVLIDGKPAWTAEDSFEETIS